MAQAIQLKFTPTFGDGPASGATFQGFKATVTSPSGAPTVAPLQTTTTWVFGDRGPGEYRFRVAVIDSEGVEVTWQELTWNRPAAVANFPIASAGSLSVQMIDV